MVYQRIRYFLKAAELGSFKKAAGQMYVSAQALTRQIGLLEEEVGGQLFERSPSGVTLTRLGEFARSRFGKIDIELNEAVEELQRRARDNKDRINVGIFSALPQEAIVTPVVSFLLAAYGNRYQTGFDLVDLEEGRRLLMDGKIDILLTNTHEEDDWCGYRRLSFGEYEAKIIVSLRHPWALKTSVTVEDMKRQTFLKMKMDSGHYRLPARESFYENIPCKNVQHVSNFDTMYALLQQGEAFGVFPLAFTQMDTAKIKSFDYPGRRFMFHTAVICPVKNSLKGLSDIVEDLKEEFDLQPVVDESVITGR